MNPRNVVFIALLALTVARAVEPLAPGPVPPEVRAQFQLAPFYQKYIGVGGLPIVGSVKVQIPRSSSVRGSSPTCWSDGPTS